MLYCAIMCCGFAICGDDVTKRLTGVAVPMTPEKLISYIRLCTITVHTEVGSFRQPVFASVASVLYDHPICLLHVKQPHGNFLTVLVITDVPSRGDQTLLSGFKNLRSNTLLHADAIVRDSRETSVSDL